MLLFSIITQNSSRTVANWTLVRNWQSLNHAYMTLNLMAESKGGFHWLLSLFCTHVISWILLAFKGTWLNLPQFLLGLETISYHVIICPLQKFNCVSIYMYYSIIDIHTDRGKARDKMDWNINCTHLWRYMWFRRKYISGTE